MPYLYIEASSSEEYFPFPFSLQLLESIDRSMIDHRDVVFIYRSGERERERERERDDAARCLRSGTVPKESPVYTRITN
jgi:hypothetical protein